MTETKRERFIRVAEARTNKIIDMLQLLGNCSSKSNYEYDDKDVTEIFTAIEKEVKAAKARFVTVEEKSSKFKLTK